MPMHENKAGTKQVLGNARIEFVDKPIRTTSIVVAIIATFILFATQLWAVRTPFVLHVLPIGYAILMTACAIFMGLWSRGRVSALVVVVVVFLGGATNLFALLTIRNLWKVEIRLLELLPESIEVTERLVEMKASPVPSVTMFVSLIWVVFGFFFLFCFLLRDFHRVGQEKGSP